MFKAQTTKELCNEIERWKDEIHLSIDTSKPNAIQLISDGMVMYVRFDIKSETWQTKFF